MKRYLEYDLNTGRIVCEISAGTAPPPSPGMGILEISPALLLDTNACLVRGGQIVRAYETTEERRERERLRREASERAKKRIREMCFEFTIAQLENDPSRIDELREEYARLRTCL